MDALKEARVKEEMVKLRQRHCRLLNRCFSHIVFVTSLGLLHQALTAPGLDTITWASVGIISYLPMAVVGQDCTFLVVASEWHLTHLGMISISDGWGQVELAKAHECCVPKASLLGFHPLSSCFSQPLQDSLSVTPAQLKLITWFLHFLQLPLIASSICSATAFDFAVRQGLQTVSRFGLGILFLDPWVSIPFQLVHSAAEFAVHLSYFEMNRVHMGLLLIAQFFTFAIHIACMAFIDVVLRQRINAQLETADAESLVSSFRRMLRSVCDGEVLLDGQMNVAQESEGLKHLILTTVNLKGRSFERLLIDEECTRFTKFIQSSTEAFLTPKPAVPPVCLRTSLRGSAGIRVAADVFHVPIPGLFGAAEPYHLLAFKEDTESRAHPEANEDSVPAELLSRQPRQAHRPGSRPGSTSMLSGSTGRSSCHGFPGLDEVFLLIDVDSQLQEVTQVELNFKRDRCAASMPSLGKLVRPSEWEKVRSSVARFAEKSSRDQSDHPKVLKRLTLQVHGGASFGCCRHGNIRDETLVIIRLSVKTGTPWLTEHKQSRRSDGQAWANMLMLVLIVFMNPRSPR